MLTTSTATWRCRMNAVLKPASHQSLASRLDQAHALSATTIPPALSLVEAATTVTAMNNPRVSTIPKYLRPEIFLPAS